MIHEKLILIGALIIFLSVTALSQTALQGGDNMDNAFVIPSIGFSDSGTTVGFTDDYDANCGVEDTGAPDVVYKYTPTYVAGIWVGLCSRMPDFYNRLYIFEDTRDNVIACAVGGCNSYAWASWIESSEGGGCVVLVPGHTYYFVIDGLGGFGNDAGNYWLNIETPSIPPPISGMVTEAGAGPITGALIRLLRDGAEVRRDITTEYGWYGHGDFLQIEPDTYTVEVSKLGYITQISDPIFAGVCQGEVVLDFALEREVPPPIGVIAGFVRKVDGVTPIEGAIVVANPHEGGFITTDTTGPDGLFILPDMQWGPYDLTASATGFVPDTIPNVGIFSSDTTWISFTLQRIPSPCNYMIGDINNDGHFTGLDVTYMVRFFKGGPHPPYSCECPLGSGNNWYVSGDVNGSCSFSGLDVTYSVRYSKGGPRPIPCSDCPPGW